MEITPEQLEARVKISEGVLHFEKGNNAGAEACFQRAAELEPDGWGSTHFATTVCLQFLPGSREKKIFEFIEKAIELFTEISERHPVEEVQSNAKRQLTACIYLRDNSPQPIIKNQV